MDGDKYSGFTFIEIIMVIVVISILATLGFVKYDKMMASQELDNAAWNIWKDLSAVRLFSMKCDCQAFVKIKNRCYLVDKISHIDTLNLPQNIGFAIAKNGPSRSPFNEAIAIDSGGKGNWKDSLVVKRDAIGSYNSGFVAVSSSKLKNITYYIGVSGAFQGINIYKWNGSSWIRL